MIFNKKNIQFDTNSTTESNNLMLKMVTSYSAFLLIILVLFFFLYHSTFDNMRDIYNLQNESTMISDVELFERDLTIMNMYCRQLLQNDKFRKIMNNDSVTDTFLTLGNAVKTSLATDVYPESLLPISEVYCYLPQSGYILSPVYFINQERFYDWIKKYPANEYDNWLKALTYKKVHDTFQPMDYLTPNYTKDYYMYVISLDDLYYMKARAMVCFVVDKEELTKRFALLQSQTDDALLITVDEGGTPVLTISTAHAPSDADILSLDFTGKFADYTVGNYSLTVGKYMSEDTGYTYYYTFPTFDSTSNISGQRILYLVIMILALMLGGGLIFIFSRRNVRPIIELGQELQDAMEAQSHLQEEVDRQRPIICASYMRRLLSGTITSEEEVTYIREYLRLPDRPLIYNVLYIVVYNNFEEAQETLPGGSGSPENLSNILSDALEAYFEHPMYYFSPSDRTYAVLSYSDLSSERDLILQMQDIILRLHNHLLDTYGIWLFAGIGKNTDSLMNVWESYQQAMEAVSYTNKNYIYYPYEFIKKDSNAFYYPPEISTKLIHFITTGNTAQVLELFNLIHQENIEERSLPINLVKFLLSDIRNTLLKARFALPASTDKETVSMLDERFNEHLSFKLCEDLAMTLCKLFSNESEDSNLVTTIEKYIAANYRDPSLGLNKISDEFQISESYFSHMFKEKTGVNFSTYLENIRMTEAARLIRETDISLNEVYIAVGYNNLNTFRRAFKKIYGITPSSMREGK